jgi:hypothetical protein
MDLVGNSHAPVRCISAKRIAVKLMVFNRA